jgi:hypothetical protein
VAPSGAARRPGRRPCFYGETAEARRAGIPAPAEEIALARVPVCGCSSWRVVDNYEVAPARREQPLGTAGRFPRRVPGNAAGPGRGDRADGAQCPWRGSVGQSTGQPRRIAFRDLDLTSEMGVY